MLLRPSLKVTAVVGAVVATALSVSACQGSSGSSSAGGTLTVLESAVANGLNPDGAASGEPATQEAIHNLYDTMITFGKASQTAGVVTPDYSKLEPELAQSWTHKGRVWTFKLRTGVKSCAGNTLTADDIVWTWARAKSVSGAAPIGWFLGNVSGIFSAAPVAPNATAKDKQLDGEVKKIDANTVQFTQLNDDALFPRTLAISLLGVFDKKAMLSHATAADPWAQKFADSKGAAGFGPYCLKSFEPGQSITYTANPGYYLKPHYKNVVVKAIPNSADRLSSVVSGDADIATNLTARQYKSAVNSGKVAVLQWTGNSSVNLELNFKIAPWGLATNQLLRQAIAYAIPYDQIVNSVYLGTAVKMGSLVPPGYVGYKPENNYNYNPAKAKQLLAQAGFPGGAGLSKYADGLQLYYRTEEAADQQPLAQLIQTALSKIGVNITLHPIDSATFASRQITKKDLPMALDSLGRPIGTDAAYATQLNFVTTAKGGIANMTNYSSATVDGLFAKAIASGDSAARNSTLGQIQDQLIKDLPWIPIVITKSTLVVRKGITNWVGSADSSLDFWTFR